MNFEFNFSLGDQTMSIGSVDLSEPKLGFENIEELKEWGIFQVLLIICFYIIIFHSKCLLIEEKVIVSFTVNFFKYRRKSEPFSAFKMLSLPCLFPSLTDLSIILKYIKLIFVLYPFSFYMPIVALYKTFDQLEKQLKKLSHLINLAWISIVEFYSSNGKLKKEKSQEFKMKFCSCLIWSMTSVNECQLFSVASTKM